MVVARNVPLHVTLLQFKLKKKRIRNRYPNCVIPHSYTSYTGHTVSEFFLSLCLDNISATCIALRPFPADSLRILLILLVMFRDVSCERIIRIWCTQKGLYR